MNSTDTIFILLIIVLLFILVIFFIYFYSFYPLAVVNYRTGNFLAPCDSNNICDNTLTCDTLTFTCKNIAGNNCTNNNDCLNDLFCSGLCVSGDTGNLNDYCPCNDGLLCTTQISGVTLCKRAPNQPCNNDSECASLYCLDNICSDKSPNAAPCTINSDCGSNNCSNGFCQPNGLITGTLNSACASSCVTYTGSNCNSGLTCSCVNGENLPGVCVSDNLLGINTPCSISNPCSNNLVCYNNLANECSNNDENCLCLFPYDNPNQIDNTVCIVNQSNLNGICFNNTLIGCDNNNQCYTNVCNLLTSTITYYKFYDENDNILLSNFVNATRIELKSFNGPTVFNTPNVKKMFSITNGNIDIIYLVDTNNGLYRMQYNSILDIIISPWEQLIAAITINGANIKNLIDASYNGNLFLIAFFETNNLNSNYTVYNFNNILTPFNYIPGIGITGTQYNNGNPIEIDYLDISYPNDVSAGNDVLLANSNNTFIKLFNSSNYNIKTIVGGANNGNNLFGLTGPVSFYRDNTENSDASGTPVCPNIDLSRPIACSSNDNISFINNYDGIPQILQFSGNIAGIILPLDRFDQLTYRVYDYNIYSDNDMPNSSIIMLVAAYDNGTFLNNYVVLSYAQATVVFPMQIGTTFKSLTTANSYYIYSNGKCS